MNSRANVGFWGGLTSSPRQKRREEKLKKGDKKIGDKVIGFIPAVRPTRKPDSARIGE